ncbi:c-type cytochrome [Asticcacaulis sp.]|uniref:c-type cytochrome n=1 Tax=Asticcacaulis sp. TaxID=1872648 RepID=UPI002BC09B2B|nr:c-type cytochrome [Asticcacaulis sp.]HTM82072.1 c-type cytochrome [Asticcacaulis sp.]
MNRLKALILAGVFVAGPGWAGPRMKTERLTLGAEVYARNCTVCHDNSRYMVNDLGPPLFGVGGRRIGSVPGRTYSSALQASYARGDTWTDAALDRMLEDPGRAHPGTPMWIGIEDKKERQALIAYLKSRTDDR